MENVKYLNNKHFIKTMIKALRKLDLHAYNSYEEAVHNIFEDLTRDLNHISNIYTNLTFKLAASIHSLTEKRLEVTNQDFLDKMSQYIKGVDLALTHRAIDLAKTQQTRGIRSVTKDEELEQKKILTTIVTKMDAFSKALTRINKVSDRFLKEAESRNLLDLKKYQHEFNQLRLYLTLNLNTVIDLLANKGKIES